MIFKQGDLVTTTQTHCNMYPQDEIPPGKTFTFWAVSDASEYCILELPRSERYGGGVYQWEVHRATVAHAIVTHAAKISEILNKLDGLTLAELGDLQADVNRRMSARATLVRNFPFTDLEMAALRAGGLVIPVIKSIRERDTSLSLKEAKDATNHYRRTFCVPADGGYLVGDR